MPGKLVLGCDSSTSATKVIAFDDHGRTVAEGAGTYPLHQEHPGWVEQDCEDWWRAFCEASRAVVEHGDVDPTRFEGIGLTHQRFTFVPMDADLRPLRRAILWNDIRCGKEADHAAATLGKQRIFERTGYPPGQWTLYKALWLQKHEPECYGKIHKLMLVQDYLIYRLTGEVATLQGACTMTGAHDIANPDRWAWDVIDELGLRRDIWIEPILPGGAVAGRVTAEAARETGLPEGLPVVTGAGDQPCGILGAGVIEPGEIGINGGTSCTNELVASGVPAREEPDYFIELSPTGDYIVENYIPSGGSALMNWYKNHFGGYEVHRSEDEGRNIWEVIYGRAADAPVGNRGVLLLPFFQGANGPFWDLNARGAIAGLHTEHGAPELVRAVIEGLAYECRREAELMSRGSGTEVALIKMYGGSARSDIWNQTFADVFDKPLVVADTAETTALGAAISAAVGTGVWADWHPAVQAMVDIARQYEPIPEHVAIYDRFYEEAYKGLYEQLRGTFAAVAKINDALEGP